MSRAATLVVLLVGCASPREGARPPSTPAPTPAPAEPFAPAPFVPDGPHLKNCRLHAGNVRASRRNGEPIRSECAFNAECFAAVGQVSGPSDGFVAMRCEDRACVCIVRNAPADSEVFETPFDAPEPCMNPEAQRRLFLRYCMAGSRLAPDDAP